MRTLLDNTIVVATESETYRTVICALPADMEVVSEFGDVFIVQPPDCGSERLLRADVALKKGLISLSRGGEERTVPVRLRIRTEDHIICDVPAYYLVGYDAGTLYLTERNRDEPQQKWPFRRVLTVDDALALGVIRARSWDDDVLPGESWKMMTNERIAELFPDEAMQSLCRVVRDRLWEKFQEWQRQKYDREIKQGDWTESFPLLVDSDNGEAAMPSTNVEGV